MDIRMPGIDGYETTRRLRHLENGNATVPVIALTASVIRSDVKHCLDAGMNGYVPKPISRPFLAKVLHEHLTTIVKEETVEKEVRGDDFLAGLSNKPQWAGRLYDACNGRKDRFTRYLEIFLAESDAAIKDWQDWMDNGRNEPLAFSIHKLMPHLKIFLENEQVTAAVLLDQELRQGWSEHHRVDLLKLKNQILSVKEEVIELMKSMT
jgi:YesN/AraC family two-component response regulator